MTDLLADQAAGLRKLLAQRALRTIAVISAEAGAGRTTVVVNLAVALAHREQSVLVIDAGDGDANAALLLEAAPSPDLIDALSGAAAGETLAANGVAGVRVLRASAGARVLTAAGSRLVETFEALAHEPGIVLIDAAAGSLRLAAAARETVLVVGPGPDSITESYRLLKQLHHACGGHRVHVLVNRAASKAHADTIFGNLSFTSRRFLNLSLEAMGHLPEDARLARAARHRQSVIAAFPHAPSARAMLECADTLLRWSHPGEDGFGQFAHRLLESTRLLGLK
jgi:flagellar biosynthesis protein FlhG